MRAYWKVKNNGDTVIINKPIIIKAITMPRTGSMATEYSTITK